MKNEAINAAIANMSKKQLAEIFPPIERKNFVVRKSWLGRNQIITFTNNKNQRVTYNHDEALKIMLPKLNILPCWKSVATGHNQLTRHSMYATVKLSSKLKL